MNYIEDLGKQLASLFGLIIRVLRLCKIPVSNLYYRRANTQLKRATLTQKAILGYISTLQVTNNGINNSSHGFSGKKIHQFYTKFSQFLWKCVKKVKKQLWQRVVNRNSANFIRACMHVCAYNTKRCWPKPEIAEIPIISNFKAEVQSKLDKFQKMPNR